MNDFESSNNTEQTEIADSWQQDESLLNFSLTFIPSLEMNPKLRPMVVEQNGGVIFASVAIEKEFAVFIALFSFEKGF